MTQTQLAEASGLMQTAISGIELGKQKPRRSTLRLLAVGLGIPFEDLAAYLEGRKRLRVTHVVGDEPEESWVDRNPALLGRAVRHLIALDEAWVEEFVGGVEGGSGSSRKHRTTEDRPTSPGRRSRREA